MSQPVSRRVLVVDDDPTIRAVLTRVVARLGAECESASGGAAAVAAVAQGRYDLVLMDLNMPDVDGIAATREILAAGAGRPMPLIVGMTGGVEEERELEAKGAGMSAVLLKPVRMADLANVLDGLAP